MRTSVMAGLFALTMAVSLAAHEEHGMHDAKMEMKGVSSSDSFTAKGEVIDMVCYLDHGATGAKHAECAKTCITSGLPVGLKADNGKVYLLVGEHKPINSTLAALAAKTVTVKGKLVTRDGISMIENAEITQ